MIRGFKDKGTEDAFNGKPVKKWRNIQVVAKRKLDLLNVAGALKDLKVPTGNRLEKLKGNRAGQYSIRINNQYRICFKWSDGYAEEVEITDYH